ncbi:hypothetical protein ABEB36_000593 [Hypothenemus hampei]|uniref:Uncharacterized protein n=1 Tax=Hypothenemus hampei TaxID=57062 RepID=A0ABD1FCD4_HYPHA
MDTIKTKISYWYMRYLLVTELFMVDTWERKLFHVITLLLLLVLSLFNHILVLGAIKYIRVLCFLNFFGSELKAQSTTHDALLPEL